MKKTISTLIWLVLVLVIPARAEVQLDIKLNFFGPAAEAQGGPGVATSFYLKSLVQRNLQVKFTAESLLAELKKTFNAPDVALLASGDLRWSSAGPQSVMQTVQIDGRDYALILTPRPKPGAVNFKVGVVEERGQDSVKDILLDTEIVLPDGEVAMLGFRDSREKSYFIALYIQGRDEEFGKDAVRLSGAARPKLVKKVDPVYPEGALRDKIQGAVVLEAIMDESGRVTDVRVATSATPLLDKAAIDAVKQWQYQPFLVNGKAQKVLFTVTITFALKAEAKAESSGSDALTRLHGSDRPRKIKDVRPVYPEEAVQKRIEGVVVLEATLDERGNVSNIRLVSPASPLLDQAAMTALAQWQYEPYRIKGKPVKVVFTVTMNFALNKE